MENADVVVVGSGAAGLSAALAAAAGGARTVLLEGSARWGGTTAVSGGQAWVPGHHADDSAEDALTYLRAHTTGRDDTLLRAFVEAAPRMAEFVQRHSPIRFAPFDAPDSFDGPCARTDRNLEPEPVTVDGSWEDLVWPPPYPPLLTNAEVQSLGLMSGGEFPHDLLRRRAAAGEVALGVGLVAGLLRGCRDAGVEMHRDSPVIGLLGRADGLSGRPEGLPGRADGPLGRVAGVRTASGDIAARNVVLACGGFEHDPHLRRDLLGPGYDHPVSPPVGMGSALRLAASAGAALAHLDESWSWPVLVPPDARWPGLDVPRPQLVTAERWLPHAIWVNRSGRRFVDEASHNCALAFAETDPSTGTPRNLPAWAIVDAAYRERYPLAGVEPGAPPPPWIHTAETLTDLAAAAGIDPRLTDTIAEYNTFAAKGADPEFGKGATGYDRHGGDPTAPHPNLGGIERPPFHAVPLNAGMVGTKGGPRTDANARVLAWDGSPIPGLYAAGNSMAAVIGPGTVSPGATIGSALTWGWLAGTHLTT